MTDQPKWTPGPWAFHKRGQRIYGGKTGGLDIAQMRINPDWEANAHLIAAAPDLYAALERALNFIANTESEMGEALPCGDAARTALAKARGETK